MKATMLCCCFSFVEEGEDGEVLFDVCEAK